MRQPTSLSLVGCLIRMRRWGIPMFHSLYLEPVPTLFHPDNHPQALTWYSLFLVLLNKRVNKLEYFLWFLNTR